MRDSHQNISLMPYAWLAQKLVNRESFDEAVREHGLPRAEIDLWLPPSAIYQHGQQLPERRHRNALRFGVDPGHGSSAGYCRPTLSGQHSIQSVIV